MLNLVPNHGRDYKSKAEIVAALDAGKDFIVCDRFNPWDGKPANKESALAAGHRQVQVRYGGQRKVTVINIKA